MSVYTQRHQVEDVIREPGWPVDVFARLVRDCRDGEIASAAESGEQFDEASFVEWIRDVLLREADKRKNAMRDGGFTANGVLFDSDLPARAAYAEYAIGFNLDPALVIPDWKASEGQYVTMDAALFSVVYPEYKTFRQQVYSWHKAKRDEIINPLATIDDLLVVEVW